MTSQVQRGKDSETGLRGPAFHLWRVSVNHKPNSFSSFYIIVSFTQSSFFSLVAREDSQLLFYSHRHINPSDRHDSNCLLITEQNLQCKVCCANGPQNNPGIVLWEDWAVRVEHFCFNYPHVLSGLGAALVEWREENKWALLQAWEQLLNPEELSWLYLCYLLLQILLPGSGTESEGPLALPC